MNLVSIEEIGTAVILSISGEITMITFTDIDNACKKFINSNLKVIAFDFHNLEFIDSFGISRVIKQSKAFSEKGTEFVLINMNDNISQIFKIATFDRLFTIMTKKEFTDTYLQK